MAENANSSFMSIGSQSKPLLYIAMNSSNGIHSRIVEFLHNPPYVLVQLVPRVDATTTTEEILEYYKRKPLAS
ncbi:hypothetical protein OSB04_025331 [Centaurea solstitialis]|uniref:Uncharacterized protein n=1 Tax=Centaurea solstitialis TaxID=347529 RepID=A0AA38SMW9_9ASTR|nr:hypothetical protein OSB04_025331 [Centaurea solstitialis]